MLLRARPASAVVRSPRRLLRILRARRAASRPTNPPGKPGVANRLGIFVTVVRDGYGGRWRLLEATVQP